MRSGNFRKKWYLLVLCLFMAIPVNSGAQEPAQRAPAKMLPPQFSGILLMESREEMEQPDKVLQVLGLRDGDIVADIGCGNGFYTLRLADRIDPHGVVFAVDVQQGMLDQLAERRREAGISNIYPILGQYEDPLLPPGKIDWMLVIDAYHEFSDPGAMLARMKESLAPGGRVALIEYRVRNDTESKSFPVPRDHAMTVNEVLGEWSPAGFELVTLLEFLPTQHFFIFKNADDKTRPDIRKLAFENTVNVSTLDNRVYFAGQPDEVAFKRFAELGVKTVINLRTDQEMATLDFNEEAVVGSNGMKYIRVPIGMELPDTSTLEEVMDALDTSADTPVLMHCFNSNRVGAVWSLYAGQKGFSLEEAISEGKDAGLSFPAFEEAVRKALTTQ
ncbi:MAG: methyltransferase domain-containing protein [Acidobacteriota bacterium]